MKANPKKNNWRHCHPACFDFWQRFSGHRSDSERRCVAVTLTKSALQRNLFRLLAAVLAFITFFSVPAG